MIITEDIFACVREWRRNRLATAFISISTNTAGGSNTSTNGTSSATCTDEQMLVVLSGMNVVPGRLILSPSGECAAALEISSRCCQISSPFLEEDRLHMIRQLRSRSIIDSVGAIHSSMENSEGGVLPLQNLNKPWNPIYAFSLKLHSPSCWWRMGDVVRLALKSPRLSLVDSTLIRHRCAAVVVVENTSAETSTNSLTVGGVTSTAKLLLPRGSQASFIRLSLLSSTLAWMRGLVMESSCGLTSGVSMDLLQVLFGLKRARSLRGEEKKKESNKEDNGSDDPDLTPSLSLLFALFGYRVEAVSPSDASPDDFDADATWRRIGANASCYFCGQKPKLVVEEVAVEHRQQTQQEEQEETQAEETEKAVESHDVLTEALQRNEDHTTTQDLPSPDAIHTPQLAVTYYHYTIHLSEQTDCSGHHHNCPWRLLFLRTVLADSHSLTSAKELQFNMSDVGTRVALLRICLRLPEVTKLMECWRRSVYVVSAWGDVYTQHPLPAAVRTAIPPPADVRVEKYLQMLQSRSVSDATGSVGTEWQHTDNTPLFDRRCFWESCFRVVSVVKAAAATTTPSTTTTTTKEQEGGVEVSTSRGPMSKDVGHWKTVYDAGRRCIMAASEGKDKSILAAATQKFEELYNRSLEQDTSTDDLASPISGVMGRLFRLLRDGLSGIPQQCNLSVEGTSKQTPLSTHDAKRIQTFLGALDHIVEKASREPAQVPQAPPRPNRSKRSSAAPPSRDDKNAKQGGTVADTQPKQPQHQQKQKHHQQHQHTQKAHQSFPHHFPHLQVLSSAEGILQFPAGGMNTGVLPVPGTMPYMQQQPQHPPQSHQQQQNFRPGMPGPIFLSPGRGNVLSPDTMGVLNNAYQQRPSVMGQRPIQTGNFAADHKGGRGGSHRGGRGAGRGGRGGGGWNTFRRREGKHSVAALAPQRLSEEINILSLLRQELRNSHEDHDGTSCVELSEEPAFRTADAKVLEILKYPSFPFIICSEAPESYQAPVPYNLENVIGNLRDQVYGIEMFLQNEEKLRAAIKTRNMHSRKTSGGKNGERESDETNPLQFFTEVLGRDACFADVSREASVVRWYTRWVASHSLCSLKEALGQLEYVLSEDGMPSGEEMREAVRSISFVEAVSTLEKDREDVIRAERHRMHSRTRTFREHLSPIAITAAPSSFLTKEEKYRYQEFHNQSEHILMMLYHAVHAQHAACGREPSLVGTEGSFLESLKSVAITSSLTGSSSEEVQYLSEAAVGALQQERDAITVLLQNIHERQENGFAPGFTPQQYRQSRLAAMVVYKCLQDDIAMLEEQTRIGKEFLMHYDSWIQYRAGTTHEDLVRHLAINAKNTETSLSSLSWNSNQGLISNPSREVSLTPPSQAVTVQLPRHIEAVREAFMSLLRLSKIALGFEGARGVHGTVYRHWMCLSLRYTCMQVVLGRWSSDLLLSGIDDITSNLVSFVAGSSSNVAAAQSHVDKLNAVLRCFLSLVTNGAAQRLVRQELLLLPSSNNGNTNSNNNSHVNTNYYQHHHHSGVGGNGLSITASTVATVPTTSDSSRCLDIPAAFCLEKDLDDLERVVTMTDKDEGVWGSLFDALWFQADPTGNAHGGFLVSNDLSIDTNKGFGFLRLASITLPDRVPKNLRSQGAAPTLYMNMRYAIHPADTAPACSFPQTVEENTTSMTSTSVIRRYGYARRVLHILAELERRQLLQEYACRPGEVDLVPLENTVYFSRQREDGYGGTDKRAQTRTTPSRSSDGSPTTAGTTTVRRYVTLAGLLPPPAVNLMRYNSILPGAPYPATRKERPSITSLTTLIGNMLLNASSTGNPMLSEMHILGERVRDQGIQDMEPNSVNIAREGAVTPDESRYILRDKSTNKSDSLVLPILRRLDEYIASPAFNKMLRLADNEMGQQHRNTQGSRFS